MAEVTIQTVFLIVVFGALAATFRSLLKTPNALGTFAAFYFLLLGFRLMVAELGPDPGFILLGDLLASLALTFFLSMWKNR